MKSVLCFGDSNTWGVNPVDDTRLPREKRWTGLLQKKLGPDYYVIEEGYNGRTTVFTEGGEIGKNGLEMVYPVMKTNYPVDMVIVMLGTNDFHSHYACSAKASAAFLGRIVTRIRAFFFEVGMKAPEILLVSPIHIGKDIADSIFWGFGPEAHQKSLELAPWIKKIADKYDCLFFDASTVAEPGCDNLHMEVKGNEPFSSALADIVRKAIG